MLMTFSFYKNIIKNNEVLLVLFQLIAYRLPLLLKCNKIKKYLLEPLVGTNYLLFKYISMKRGVKKRTFYCDDPLRTIAIGKYHSKRFLVEPHTFSP